jgi:hypothetical protein
VPVRGLTASSTTFVQVSSNRFTFFMLLVEARTPSLGNSHAAAQEDSTLKKLADASHTEGYAHGVENGNEEIRDPAESLVNVAEAALGRAT